MSDNDDAFFEAAAEAAAEEGKSSASEVARLSAEAMKIQQEISVLEDELSGKKGSLNKILTGDLPAAMEEAGTDYWRDPETGTVIELETAVNSALPKDQDKRNAMFAALRPLGVDDILAQEFNVLLAPDHRDLQKIRALFFPGESKVEPEIAQRIAELRDLTGLTSIPAEEKLGVHPARLKSWLKEMINSNPPADETADESVIEQDDPIDPNAVEPPKRTATDVIRDAGIWFGRQAKIKPPRKGKKR